MKNWNHAKEYPTLACIAIDLLPAQASSVPCEHLFSACKKTAMDHHSCLSADRFEQLQVLKFAWCDQIPNLTTFNNDDENFIDLTTYEVLHAEDVSKAALNKEFGLGDDYMNLCADEFVLN